MPEKPRGSNAAPETESVASASDTVESQIQYLTRTLEAQNRNVEILQQAMGTVLAFDGLSTALAEIAGQLEAGFEPLQYITPPRVSTDLPNDVKCAMAALELSLARPAWSNVESLSIEVQNVMGIGDPNRPLPPELAKECRAAAIDSDHEVDEQSPRKRSVS